MQPFDLHPEFYNQPIWVTEEEKQNPTTVIENFFGDISLLEVRQHLSNMLEVALVSTNSIYTEPKERNEALCINKELEKLVEAAWLLNKR